MNAGERARFGQFVFSVSIQYLPGDTSDLDMTILSSWLTCFRIQRFYKMPKSRTTVSHLSVCRILHPLGISLTIVRALMGSEIRGTSCGHVASHYFNISYQGAKRLCKVLPYCKLVGDWEVSHG